MEVTCPSQGVMSEACMKSSAVGGSSAHSLTVVSTKFLGGELLFSTSSYSGSCRQML